MSVGLESERPSRDDVWLDQAFTISRRSKDRSTRVGCVIVGEYDIPLAQGYNGIPRGCDDDAPHRHKRPGKYYYFEHGERNAIFNAARKGHALNGSKMYLTAPPCADCSRAIIQVGIIELICASDIVPKRFKESCSAAMEMLQEAKVKVRLPNSEEAISDFQYVDREGWGDDRSRPS